MPGRKTRPNLTDWEPSFQKMRSRYGWMSWEDWAGREADRYHALGRKGVRVIRKGPNGEFVALHEHPPMKIEEECYVAD